MKNLLLFIVCIFMHLTLSYSQEDKQWLIKNSAGKSDYTTTGINVFGNTVGSSEFTLDSISHPNRSCNALARNDIFVIYNDGNHYNSRWDTQNPDFFYPRTSDQNLSQLNHRFSIPGKRNIVYMYMTNIYEGDDPPKRVSINHVVPGQNTTPYALGISLPDTSTITADHDIVAGTDITLVFNSKSLLNTDKLFFNIKAFHGPGFGSPGNFFSGSSIFPGNKSISEGDLIPISGGGYQISGLPAHPKPYIYINLRSTDLLTRFFPSDPGSPPTSEIVFEINGDTHHYRSSETLMASHDPNRMWVQNVCSDQKSGLFVNYHIEFRNSSMQPADHLSIKITLPVQLDPCCIGYVKWRAGDNSTDNTVGKITSIGQDVKFTFNANATVQPCDSLNDPKREHCTGSIDFCVAVKKGMQAIVENESTSLRLIGAAVSFGSTDYPIEIFYDKSLVHDGKTPTSVRREKNTAGCNLCYCQAKAKRYVLSVLVVILLIITPFIIWRKKLFELFSPRRQ